MVFPGRAGIKRSSLPPFAVSGKTVVASRGRGEPHWRETKISGKEVPPMETKMLTPLAKSTPLLLAIALALSGCAINYHVNPDSSSWPAAKPPAPAPK
jgi:hypothetical protein